MKSFLNNLKLIHKINIVFYISILIILILIGVFYTSTTLMTKNLQDGYNKQIEIQKHSNTITDNLKLLDYLTIENSLTKQNDYKEKSKLAYDTIFKNLDTLKKSEFFAHTPNAIKTIEHIKTRLLGYKTITNTFSDEVQEDFEDGLFAVLALSTTSHIISEELNKLNEHIKKIFQNRAISLKLKLHNMRRNVIMIIALVFLMMLYLNSKVVHSILNPLIQLKDVISSFFDVLLKKREHTLNVVYNANDEIASIAKVIDSNMHIAEDIVLKEREESKKIEQLVKNKTKEITELNEELEATQREVIFIMGTVSEERSKETGYHVKRVAEYSLILARLYGLSLEESLLLKNASPMHDIGKIGIPDAILNKPGKFTDEEFKVIQSHAEIGYTMLKHSSKSILKAAAIVAYEHHEKWNGKGYPQGLKGEEIHIYGRITAIADVFDALGSDRVYKKAWSLEKILKLFEEERGEHFDPVLTDLFIDNLEHFIAAKENIENNEDNLALSKYIENFNRVDNILTNGI